MALVLLPGLSNLIDDISEEKKPVSYTHLTLPTTVFV